MKKFHTELQFHFRLFIYLFVGAFSLGPLKMWEEQLCESYQMQISQTSNAHSNRKASGILHNSIKYAR